ncbi:fluoride efflux transporter CrcB [soil metagenome]
MTAAVLFVLAAAAGTIARAEITRRLNWPNGLPFGTLVVNVTGSFLLGLAAEVAPPALTVLGVGGLGAYTTFSGLAGDAVTLAARRRATSAALYVALSCGGGIAAAACGLAVNRSLS